MKVNNSFERDVIIISFYSHIIENLLKEHGKLSIFKTIVFSFLIKKQEVSSKIYNSNNKNDVMLKFLSQLSGEFSNFVKDLDFLFKSIDILVKSNKVEYIDNGVLRIKDFEVIYKSNNDLLYKAIKESNHYSDEQFMKEVLYYV